MADPSSKPASSDVEADALDSAGLTCFKAVNPFEPIFRLSLHFERTGTFQQNIFAGMTRVDVAARLRELADLIVRNGKDG